MERPRTRPEPEYLLGLSTHFLSLRDLPKCRHYALQARKPDPLQSSAADKILAVADVLIAADCRVHDTHLDYYGILQIRRSESENRRAIRSQFKKLAALLNPNVNKFAFSEEAFNLVRESWSVLSDPDKKTQYDTEIDSPENHAFWTLCPYCYYMYEYEKVYEDCCLRCQNCRKGFHGVAVKAPPKTAIMDGKSKDEKEYSFCWGYFPLGFEKEKVGKTETQMVGSGKTVILGGYYENDSVKGNVGNGRNVKTKAGRMKNVKSVGIKTKKVLGINDYEGMDLKEEDAEDVFVGLV